MKQTWQETVYPSKGLTQLPAKTIAYEPIVIPPTSTEEYTADGKRFYRHIATGARLASISTLLSETDVEGNKALTEWRRNIGAQAAQDITNKSADHGNWAHNFCDDYLSNKPVWPYLDTTDRILKATAIAVALNERIHTVVGSELRVSHVEWGVAGRFDLLAYLKRKDGSRGRLAVIDFKTGRKKPKADSRLKKYAMQATFYARAVDTTQHFDAPIDAIVIFQLTPEANVWQESHPDMWEADLLERIADHQLLKA